MSVKYLEAILGKGVTMMNKEDCILEKFKDWWRIQTRKETITRRCDESYYEVRSAGAIGTYRGTCLQ